MRKVQATLEASAKTPGPSTALARERVRAAHARKRPDPARDGSSPTLARRQAFLKEIRGRLDFKGPKRTNIFVFCLPKHFGELTLCDSCEPNLSSS